MVGKNDKMENVVIIGDAEDGAALLALCPDLPEWPQRWHIESNDIPVGEHIVDAFKPFLRHMIRNGLAPRTLKRHRDHLWMLGGELIRRRQDDPDLKRQSVSELLSELIDEETGPLIWPRITESQQEAFDATCRKLHRFLCDTSAGAHKP
ncbi:MAG: hypothetical protein WBM59_15730 [Sedimenticolaceae bacterium]|jgi:hypothetical protein